MSVDEIILSVCIETCVLCMNFFQEIPYIIISK